MNNITFRDAYSPGNPITRLDSPAPATYILNHNHSSQELDRGVIQSCIDAINNITNNHRDNRELTDSLKTAANYHRILLRAQEAQEKRKQEQQLPSTISTTSQNSRSGVYTPSSSAPQRSFYAEVKEEKIEDTPYPEVSQSNVQGQGDYSWQLVYDTMQIKMTMTQTRGTLIEISQRLGASLTMSPEVSHVGFLNLREIITAVITVNVEVPRYVLIGVPEDVNRDDVPQPQPDYTLFNEVKTKMTDMFSQFNIGTQGQAPSSAPSHQLASPTAEDPTQPNLYSSEYASSTLQHYPYSQTSSQAYSNSQGQAQSYPVSSEEPMVPVPDYLFSQTLSQTSAASSSSRSSAMPTPRSKPMPAPRFTRTFVPIQPYPQPSSLETATPVYLPRFEEIKKEEDRGVKRPAPSQTTTTTTSEPDKKKIKVEPKAEEQKPEKKLDVFIKKEKSEDDEDPS